MHSTDLPRGTDVDTRRQRLLALERKARAVQESGNRAHRNRQEEMRQQDERYREEDSNKELSNLGALGWVEAAIALLACVAVYFIDLSILSASADYFSKLAFADSPSMQAAMRLLVPFVVLVLDVFLGLGFWRARRKLLRDPKTRVVYRRWAMAAGIFVLLMPLFASASAIAAVMSVAQADVQRLLGTQGVATALLAFIAHGGILLGASRIERALSYFLYRRRHAALSDAEITFRDAAELNENECWEQFQSYFNDLRLFNVDFGVNLTPGPLDRFTTALLNERMGRNVVGSWEREAATT
jgi:hypothetical protein